MNILIIGNGFDLAHDLPTKYEHFLEYIDAFERLRDICIQESIESDWSNENIKDEDRKYIGHFATLHKYKKSIFEEVGALVSDNVWINYFWKIYKSRKFAEKDGWIDFENEISRMIQTFDKARLTILKEINQGKQTAGMTQQQLKILAPILGEIERNSFDEKVIEDIKKQFLEDLNKLIRCLEIYLDEFVEKLTPQIKLSGIKALDIHCVLSFNYTHTYERFYDTDNKMIKYDYVHGEVKPNSNIENCNLILGIDEYLEGDAKNKDNEFIQFKKFYQRIYKKTGCKYIDWQRNIIRYSRGPENSDTPLNNIYIIGHSLDITDKDILSSLINMENTKTTIFYYNQEALGNQINNLVKVLGEDELISKVHGVNASIVLQEQQILLH